jgi:hypothetical protein
MTPQESELIAELFDRLAQLESSPRDPDAERAIAEGLRRAPHAIYALVQTVLVQDEALKQADARIRQLEAAMGGQSQGGSDRGFLGSMRDSLLGRREAPRAGSVPQVRPDTRSADPSPWNTTQQAPMQPQPYGGGMQPPPPPPYGGGMFSGGSFLGNAAATVAGVVGGGLLLDGIRSAFGGHHGGPFGAYDQPVGGAPGSGGGGGSDQLSHQAGLDDIGHGGSAGLGDFADNDRAGLVDGADNDDDNDTGDTDYDDDAGGGSDGDTDYA